MAFLFACFAAALQLSLSSEGASQSGEQAGYYNDDLDPSCALGTSCTGHSGDIPENRGLCVLYSGQHQCWDVCNLHHANTDYVTSPDLVRDEAASDLVTLVRAGRNPAIWCGNVPEGLCRPGIDRCGDRKIAANRGLCTLVDNGIHQRQCLDMCDLAFDPEDYCAGGSEGCLDLVKGMRAGTVHPGCYHGLGVLGVLGLLLMICCCLMACTAFLYYCHQRRKQVSPRGEYQLVETASRPEPQQAYAAGVPMASMSYPAQRPMITGVPMATMAVQRPGMATMPAQPYFTQPPVPMTTVSMGVPR